MDQGRASSSGTRVEHAATVALSIGQIEEFSFVLAAVGRKLALFPDAGTQALVVVSMISITLNPLLFRLRMPLRPF